MNSLRCTIRWTASIMLILLSACTLERGAPTPEAAGLQAALQVERQTPWQRLEAKVHGTRTTPWGVLVLYTRDNPEAKAPIFPRQMGLVMTQQRGQWWERSGALWQVDVVPVHETAIEYRTGSFPLVNVANAVVFGRVLRPDVTTIEVVFDNGQTVHDTVTGEMFAVVALNATVACVVRALDADGNLLQRFDPLAEQPVADSDAQARHKARCRNAAAG